MEDSSKATRHLDRGSQQQKQSYRTHYHYYVLYLLGLLPLSKLDLKRQSLADYLSVGIHEKSDSSLPDTLRIRSKLPSHHRSIFFDNIFAEQASQKTTIEILDPDISRFILPYSSTQLFLLHATAATCFNSTSVLYGSKSLGK